MANPENGKEEVDISEVFRTGYKIDEAVRLAFRDAVIQHRRNGVPMVFCENGKVVEMSADDVPID